jgi:hypothetical protein
MVTLSILVTSLATIGFHGEPHSGVAERYDHTFHFATASLYASEEGPPAPAIVPEPPLSGMEEQSSIMQGEAYYVQGCDDCCPTRYPGFYAGGEITALRPFVGGTCLDTPCFLESALSVQDKVLPDFDTYVAPRLWLGYTSCSGVGCRVRWWRMDLNASDSIDFTDATQNRFVGDTSASLDVQVLDFEVTDTFTVAGKWDVLASGGVRYVDFDWSKTTEGVLSIGSTDFQDFSHDGIGFEGVGPTAAIEARRPWFHRLGLFANVRGSLMFGKMNVLTISETIPPFRADIFEQGDLGGMVRSIWEAQLGVDCTHELWRGTYLTTRVAGEAQYWSSMLANNNDIGFVGMTASVALIR